MTLMQRDIVVIGASRGGVAALSLLVSDLPCDLAASLFVVLHIRPDVPGCLAGILSQAGRLPDMYATNLQPIVRAGEASHRQRLCLRAGQGRNDGDPNADALA